MASYARLKKAMAHRSALLNANTPEGRKEYKGTLTFRIRQGRTCTRGFFEPTGRSPVRCKG